MYIDTNNQTDTMQTHKQIDKDHRIQWKNQMALCPMTNVQLCTNNDISKFV